MSLLPDTLEPINEEIVETLRKLETARKKEDYIEQPKLEDKLRLLRQLRAYIEDTLSFIIFP